MIEFLVDTDQSYEAGSRYEFGNGLEELYVQRRVARFVVPEPDDMPDESDEKLPKNLRPMAGRKFDAARDNRMMHADEVVKK